MAGDRDHDVIGVGIGPFNLGLAALADPVADLDAVFFDTRPQFSWHPGLLLEGVSLQVPFLADLVTMADPTSPYSFLNYLHCRNRLYRFYFYEQFHIPRREYDAYCRWVADQLPSCRFGWHVLSVRPTPDERWSVEVAAGPSAPPVEHRADAVVFGVGSTPRVPDCARDQLSSTAGCDTGNPVLHSAHYVDHRDRVRDTGDVTVVGSGQSAAEVVADLLTALPDQPDLRLRWFTSSRGFLPMEYSKLGLEHFTPEYTAYFHGLDEARRDELRAGQDLLYKGISAETSGAIYDRLYEASVTGDEPDVAYTSACELIGLEPVTARPDTPRLPDITEPDIAGWRLQLRHKDQGIDFEHHCRSVILATGYEPAALPLDAATAARVVRDDQGRPVIDLDYRIRLEGRPKSTLFAQNAELHTHGVGAPDLGLGAHRSAVLVNALAGREVYPVRSRNVFQTFGAPK